MPSLSDRLALAKDSFTVLREGLLVIVFVLFLGFPAWINGRLSQAGFTEGSIAGFKWQNQIEESSRQAKDAGQAITDIQPKLQEMSARLSELAGKTTDSQTVKAISDLSSTLRASEAKVRQADTAVKSALVTQERVLSQVAPATVESTGWMYVGELDESKTQWETGNPTTIETTEPRLTPGQIVKIKDDVYLRDASAGPGKRASGKIVSVGRVGDSVKILDIDETSHDNSAGSGWFVWAKVARLG